MFKMTRQQIYTHPNTAVLDNQRAINLHTKKLHVIELTCTLDLEEIILNKALHFQDLFFSILSV